MTVNAQINVKKYYRIFEWLCCLIYFTSYITRINFGAVVAEIITSEGFAKSAISIVVFMNFLSYGFGQLISGYLGDKIKPHKLILFGFVVTASCNFMIPMCSTIPAMTVVWFFNGFAQAMMWPPLLKMMSQYLPDNRYGSAMANVSAASSIGRIFVYLAAPLFIQIGSWRTVFYFCSGAAMLITLLLAFALPRIIKKIPANVVKQTENAQNCTEGVWSNVKKFGLIYLCVAIMLQGAIRDGITTWLPTCITEVFRMEAAASILVSVVLPIFAIVSFKFFGYIQSRYVKNEPAHAALLFGGCTVLAVTWGLTYSSSVVFSLLLASLIDGLIHGINLIIVCVLPKRFAASGKVSMISGILNFSTYVGSALSTYGMAKIAEFFGWQASIFTWGGAAALGILMCAICIKKFKKA